MRRVLLALGCLAIAAALLAYALGSSHRRAHSARAVPVAPAPGAVAPRPGWLGLNGNTSNYLGPIDTFSRAGVVFDRNLELEAGSLPGEGAPGTPAAELPGRLAEEHLLGMSPVAVIDYRGYGRPGYEFREDPEFPRRRSAAEAAAGRQTIAGYVAGFIRSAAAIRALAGARDPGTEVRFEVMNEPWGNTTPAYDAGEYAEVLAALLPAAAAAGIPARDIYVAATGAACTAGSCRANGWVPALYRAEPALRQEIAGWYLHPYGPPTGVDELDDGGIQAVPLIRAGMASGRENLIVSEVGFCSRDVNNPSGSPAGSDCHGAPVLSSEAAAASLQRTLEEALVYHREGWLVALIVYSRNDGGWAMQLPGGALTPSGRVLLRFASAQAPG